MMCAFLKSIFEEFLSGNGSQSVSLVYHKRAWALYSVLPWQFLIFSESLLSWDKVACNIINNHIFLKYGN